MPYSFFHYWQSAFTHSSPGLEVRGSAGQGRRRGRDREATLQSPADRVLWGNGRLHPEPARPSVGLSPQHSVWNTCSHLPHWRAWPIPPAPGLARQASTFQRAAQQWDLLGGPPRGRVRHRCPCDKCSRLQEHWGCTSQCLSLVPEPCPWWGSRRPALEPPVHPAASPRPPGQLQGLREDSQQSGGSCRRLTPLKS